MPAPPPHGATASRASSWHAALILAAVATALAASTLAAEARAGPTEEPFRLVWVRGPGGDSCVAGPVLAGRVTERLGKNPFSEAARRSLEGLVQREGERWVAHLYVRDAEGHLQGSRDLASEGPECSSLDLAMTLAIALVIDPDAALRPPAAPSASAPSPANPSASAARSAPAASISAPPPAPVPPRTEEMPAARPPHTETTVTARAAVATALLPKVAAGAAVSTDLLLHGRLRGQFGILFFPETHTAQGDFAFGLTALGAGACVDALRFPAGALAACGDLHVGSLHSVVFSLEPTSPGDRLWGGAAASARLTLRLAGPFTMEAGGGLMVPLVRHRFFVENRPGTVFQQPAAGFLGFLGLGATIF